MSRPEEVKYKLDDVIALKPPSALTNIFLNLFKFSKL